MIKKFLLFVLTIVISLNSIACANSEEKRSDATAFIAFEFDPDSTEEKLLSLLTDGWHAFFRYNMVGEDKKIEIEMAVYEYGEKTYDDIVFSGLFSEEGTIAIIDNHGEIKIGIIDDNGSQSVSIPYPIDITAAGTGTRTAGGSAKDDPVPLLLVGIQNGVNETLSLGDPELVGITKIAQAIDGLIVFYAK